VVKSLYTFPFFYFYLQKKIKTKPKKGVEYFERLEVITQAVQSPNFKSHILLLQSYKLEVKTHAAQSSKFDVHSFSSEYYGHPLSYGQTQQLYGHQNNGTAPNALNQLLIFISSTCQFILLICEELNLKGDGFESEARGCAAAGGR
jgi:hypothetical protein